MERELNPPSLFVEQWIHAPPLSSVVFAQQVLQALAKKVLD
jgi:hypothetical protein